MDAPHRTRRPSIDQENPMKRTIVAAALVAAFNIASALPAAAATPEDRARAAAAESPTALRHFVHRTRMIYGLYIYDFAVGDNDAGASAEGSSAQWTDEDRERNDRQFAELRAQIAHYIDN
jgi:hypothetical protein